MCQDYIYDKEMEQIAKEEQRKAWKMQGTATLNNAPSDFDLSGTFLHQSSPSNGTSVLNHCILRWQHICNIKIHTALQIL